MKGNGNGSGLAGFFNLSQTSQKLTGNFIDSQMLSCSNEMQQPSFKSTTRGRDEMRQIAKVMLALAVIGLTIVPWVHADTVVIDFEVLEAPGTKLFIRYDKVTIIHQI